MRPAVSMVNGPLCLGEPHPSHRWIVRLPADHCGAGWRIMVPESPGHHTSVAVYDHAHGGCWESSLAEARRQRDLLCRTMPFPLTAIIRQYRDGTYSTRVRLNADRETGPVWTAEYQRLDETTLRIRSAVVSRSVSAYGTHEARELVERAWRQKVLEQADFVDRLVRAGVPILHHGPASGDREGRGSRYRVHARYVEAGKPPGTEASTIRLTSKSVTREAPCWLDPLASRA